MKIGALTLQAGRICVVAEPSGNHCGDKKRALRLVEHAKESGADAVKFQPIEPSDHVPHASDHPAYRLTSGPWAGRTLHELYQQAQTPYAWLPELIERADAIGLPWFASVVSARGLDILDKLGCPAFKVPSAEVADARFVELVASAGKPVILSDGMATPSQMSAAMRAVPTDRLVVLKCVSEYPAPASGYNLSTLKALQGAGILAGVSDHTTERTVPIVAATLGAVMLEKHLMAADCLEVEPLDKEHSLSPFEFKCMVRAVRDAEAALGRVVLGATTEAGRGWRRRLVASRDLPSGHTLEQSDVTTARCGAGCEPDTRYAGRTLTKALAEGEPLMEVHLAKVAA